MQRKDVGLTKQIGQARGARRTERKLDPVGQVRIEEYNPAAKRFEAQRGSTPRRSVNASASAWSATSVVP
jgi:hypothetical protein